MRFELPPTSSAQRQNASPMNIKLINFRQSTTRADTMEKGEDFKKEDLDFSSVIDHVRIHQGGSKVAGSQFNSEIIKTPQQLVDSIKELLPPQMHYDQFNRAEITLEVAVEGQDRSQQFIGWSGVFSIEDIQKRFPNIQIEKKVRMPGGTPGELEGVKGAWYPEMGKNPETGQFEVLKDENGNIKNPKWKFEPEANIVTVSEEEFKEGAGTNLITVIIAKSPAGKPTVLTVFPGDNAPPFPAKIEAFGVDTLKEERVKGFWDKHVFVKAE
ncbi:hypothetical protein D6821_00630 [Candidatus Parcubacteria bacterium]|nr:MAG: hypothetical protein D6821_00630 [Candidatus Parcubacteria bacterium]